MPPSDFSSPKERLLASLAAQAGDDPVRLRTLALALAAQERNEEALAAFRRAVTLDPGYAEAWTSLALLLLDLKRIEEALAAAREATRCAPDDKGAWHALGIVLHKLDRLDEAVTAQARAIELDPTYRTAWLWLGFSREIDGDLAGAAQAYDRAQALRAELKTSLNLAFLGPCYATDMAQIEWARARMLRESRRLADTGLRIEQPHLMVDKVTGSYAYWGGEDRPLHEAHAEFWRRVAPYLSWTAPHVGAWQPPSGRRPRIAWITHYLFRHTLDRMWGGLVRALPQLGFDVQVFTTFDGASPERDAIEAATGPVTVLPQELDEARRLVAAFEPDIVIYPELGLHRFTYFLAFARLAPLQITTWGHAATSGLDSIDVFLGSSDIDPPGAERFYTEELVRLDPPPVCYRRELPSAGQSSRAALGLPQDATLYLVAQSLLKLRPDFDAVLARILAADPKGFLVILGPPTLQSLRILKRRLAAAIPDSERRVRLIDWLPGNDFVALLRMADAVLDTHHFAGGSSSYDLVSLGCPFVTLPGPASKGRAGTMLYRAIGVEDLIARDEDHYVELAVRLANDRPWREALAARIAAASPMLDDWQPGLAVFARWLHARIAQTGKSP